MNEWVKMLLIGFVCFAIMLVIFFGIIYFHYSTEEDKKNDCIEEFKSKGFSGFGKSDCEEQICDGFGLSLSTSGNWAKALIYCEGKNGGIIKVEMPQNYEDEKCREYFKARWEQAYCLYNAKYLESTT